MEKRVSNRKHGKQNDSTKDKLFDPSIDMLVNDFDDERTLEEEEALAEAEDPQVELSSLQKESNMPLEELLALYGYSSENKENNVSTDEAAEETSSRDMESVDDSPPSPKVVSKLRLLYEPLSDDSDTKRSGSLPHEEDDFEYHPEDDELRKTIMVGSSYQARVPRELIREDLPYEHEDKLLWNPTGLEGTVIEKYLEKVYELKKPPLPIGTQLRDDEEALYLLQECGYNTEEALERLKMTIVRITPPEERNE